MGMGFINGLMDLLMKENGSKIRSQGLEFILGLMEGAMRENGLTITWKDLVNTNGLMEECFKESTRTIKSRVMESTNGLTKESIKETGQMASSMDLENTSFLKKNQIRKKYEKQSMDFGKMENEFNGSQMNQLTQSKGINLIIVNISRIQFQGILLILKPNLIHLKDFHKI